MKKATFLTLLTVTLLTFGACSSADKQTTETVTVKGKVTKLSGTKVSVGDTAPIVTVVTTKLVEKTLGGKTKKTQVIVIVPSVDTPTCALETRTFNERVAGMDNVDLTIVSIDTPFAGGRFCAAEGIENVAVASDFRYNTVGKSYGVMVEEGVLKGVLARSIFIVKEGKIVYKELVKEISKEPNYDAALNAI